MLVWVLLPCRSVRHPAIGAAEIFGHPYVAGHPANMQKTQTGSSRYPALELTTSYSNFIKPADGLVASRVDDVRFWSSLRTQVGRSDMSVMPVTDVTVKTRELLDDEAAAALREGNVQGNYRDPTTERSGYCVQPAIRFWVCT
jgi:hypothetical protein